MKRQSLIIVAAAATGFLMAVPMLATADGRFTRELNIDRSGNDIRVESLPVGADAAACEALCTKTAACVAFTYVKQSTTVPQPVCRIKDQAPFGHESNCCVSGALKK